MRLKAGAERRVFNSSIVVFMMSVLQWKPEAAQKAGRSGTPSFSHPYPSPAGGVDRLEKAGVARNLLARMANGHHRVEISVNFTGRPASLAPLRSE
jgi:hypothetical protein